MNKYNCVYSGVASDFEFENYHIFKSKILKAKKDGDAKLFNLVQKDCTLSFNLVCEESAIQKFVTLGFVCTKEKQIKVIVQREKKERKKRIRLVNKKDVKPGEVKRANYDATVIEKNKDIIELYNSGEDKNHIADLLDISEWKVRFVIKRIYELQPELFDKRKEYEERIAEEKRKAKEEKRLPKNVVVKHESIVRLAKIRVEEHRNGLLENNAYLIELYNKNEKTIPVLAKELGLTVKRFNHVVYQIRQAFPDVLISRIAKKYTDDVLISMIKDDLKYPTYESIANALGEPYINVKMAIYRIGEKYGIKREKKSIDTTLVSVWNDLEKYPTKKDVYAFMKLSKHAINERLARLRRAGHSLIVRKERKVFIKNFEAVWNDVEKYPTMYSVKQELRRCEKDIFRFIEMLTDRGIVLIKRK